MSESQLDFFSDMDIVSEQSASPHISHALVPAQIDDATLITAIPESSLADSAALAAEAGRRHLAAAVRPWPTCAGALPGSGRGAWSASRLLRSRLLR
jgi:hypothetical protein